MFQTVTRALAGAPAIILNPRPDSRGLWRARLPQAALHGRARPGQEPVRQGHPPVLPDGQICGLAAVDIARFSAPNRDDDIRIYLHRCLYAMLQAAFNRSGVPWHACAHEDRGDGAFIVIPPAIPVSALLRQVPDGLAAQIRHHNKTSCESARIQLRLAVHAGPVHHDGHGFVGYPVNHLHRMIDAPALRRLQGESGAEIVLITSTYLYENVVIRYPSLTGSATFTPLTVRVKETRTRAWASALGLSPCR